MASQPGPLVSPAPAIVLPPQAMPFTAPAWPRTSIAGVPGLRVSRICTSAESAWQTLTYVGLVGLNASRSSGLGSVVEAAPGVGDVGGAAPFLADEDGAGVAS